MSPEQDEASSSDELSEIRRAALNWLRRRDYSQREIAQKLQLKHYSKEVIHTVLTQLVEAGLINEARFTENYIYWRRGKGFGPLRIKLELQGKGIDPEMIAEHIKITDNAWLVAVQKVSRKHFKAKIESDMKLRAKQIRFLQYRGFTQEHIEYVLETTEP